jgi:SAM-dependent methyltransferase
MDKRAVSDHFDRIAGEYDGWKARASYYYDLLTEIYRELIPEGGVVLEIGCGTGTLLSRMKPRRGMGVDISPRMIEIASRKYPEYEFRAEDAAALTVREQFEYVMLPDVIEHLPDVRAVFSSIHGACGEGSKVVVTCVNPLWAPVLHLAERLGMKMPEGDHRWLSKRELAEAALSGGFDLLSCFGRILLPKKVPGLSGWLNALPQRFHRLFPVCLVHVYVFGKILSQGASATRMG